jgi:hypothetical protein
MLLRLLVFSLLIFSSNIHAGWFCEDAASEKNENIILTCGIGEAENEADARKNALKSAFEELDSLCEKSVDCKTMETLIEPQRSDCRKEKKIYKCYRAIQATITNTKRKKPFAKEESNKTDLDKLNIIVKIDPNDLIKIDNKAEPNKPVCSSDITNLAKSLHDISTSDKQQDMINEAIKIPFDMLCANIHLRIISVLSRYKIKNESYQDFLLKTIESIDDTTADDRTYWILDYFKEVGPMDDKEWDVSLRAMERASRNALYRLMPRLLNDHASTGKQQDIEKKRVDLIVKAIESKKIGRPMPINFDEGFEVLMRSVHSYKSRDNPWLALYTIENYQKKLDLSAPDKVHKSLKKIYSEAKVSSAKSKINLALAKNVSQSEPSNPLSKLVVDHLQDFQSSIEKLDDEEDEDIKQIEMYTEMRKDFIKTSGKKLIDNINMTQNDYEIKSRTHLCLELSLPCDGLIPDQERLKKMLTSKKSGKRLEALDTLMKMPEAAKNLEKEITDCLKVADKGKIDNSNALIKSSAMTLAMIPTSNKQTLKLISDLVLRSRLSTQYIRNGLGKNLEPFWIDELKSSNTRHHNFVMLELKNYETLSTETCQYLRIRKNPNDPYFIKDGITAALELCK